MEIFKKLYSELPKSEKLSVNALSLRGDYSSQFRINLHIHNMNPLLTLIREKTQLVAWMAKFSKPYKPSDNDIYFFVSKRRRREGLGSKLFDFLIEEASIDANSKFFVFPWNFASSEFFYRSMQRANDKHIKNIFIDTRFL